MANRFPKMGEQIKRHSVALISLAVAISSLAYNTWRNEQSEVNRNVRTAAIELILKLSELDQVVFLGHYDKDPVNGNPRIGWALVLTIRDLGQIAGEPVTATTIELLETWQSDWDGLGNDQAAADRISAAIEQVRADSLLAMEMLD